MESVVIIGSGPAGLTAAIYAARANLSPVVIDGMQPGGQLTQTTDVENFPGFELPINGFELMENMRKQCERLGVRFVMDEVTECDLSGDVKHLSLSMSDAISARTVIIATGASARYLGLESEQRFVGKGVSACATCDGAFYKGQRVAVIGGGDTAMEEALYLSRIASEVMVVHRRDEFRASHIMGQRVLETQNIKVMWNSVLDEVLGSDADGVSGLRLRNVKDDSVSEHDLQGVFIAIGHTPNTAPFAGQIELDDEGYVVATDTCTSLKGVFAAGDVQDRNYKQAVTAAGTGCIAALQVERYLAENG